MQAPGIKINVGCFSFTQYDDAKAAGALIGDVDDEGYIWNPWVENWTCVSARMGTSTRNQRGRGMTGPDTTDVVRLVRNLD